MKELCPKCRNWYSTSTQRDKSKVFVCADCAGLQLQRMTKKKYTPIYDCRGFACVYA